MQHLDQNALAARWLISHRTLEQWRWHGRGPRFLKVGTRVVYRLSDIEAFEAANLHANTNGPVGEVSQEDVPMTSLETIGERKAGAGWERFRP